MTQLDSNHGGIGCEGEALQLILVTCFDLVSSSDGLNKDESNTLCNFDEVPRTLFIPERVFALNVSITALLLRSASRQHGETY